jgi:hypothetical protein
MPRGEATNPALRCYRCGGSLAALTLPLSRLDLCPDCSVELHVCRMCLHYAPAKPDACDEDDAEEVRNKTVANFCDYFAPNPQVFDGSERQADTRARMALEALFGSAPAAERENEAAADEDGARRQAEDLFRK